MAHHSLTHRRPLSRVPAGRSIGRGGAGRRKATALAAALPLVIAACGTVSMTAPPATPTDFPGITGRLNAAQIKVRNWVSGDAGCQDPDLVKSAISFDASGLDQSEPVRLYLYIFRDEAAFERHRDQVGPCAEAWVTDRQTYEEIEQSPYIVAGQGPWGSEFEATLRSTLEEAAGTGG